MDVSFDVNQVRNKSAVLKDIEKSSLILKHTETVDKSKPYIDNVKLSKKRPRSEVLEAIKQGKELRHVGYRRDRSAPRIEHVRIQKTDDGFLSNLAHGLKKLVRKAEPKEETPVDVIIISQKKIINKEIETRTRGPQFLVHVAQPRDRSAPVLEKVSIKRSARKQLNEEIAKGVSLRHVSTNDRSAPLIEKPEAQKTPVLAKVGGKIYSKVKGFFAKKQAPESVDLPQLLRRQVLINQISGGLFYLKHVEVSDISDRSAPRILGAKVSKSKRKELNQQILVGVTLRHVTDIKDRSAPRLEKNAKPVRKTPRKLFLKSLQSHATEFVKRFKAPNRQTFHNFTSFFSLSSTQRVDIIQIARREKVVREIANPHPLIHVTSIKDRSAPYIDRTLRFNLSKSVSRAHLDQLFIEAKTLNYKVAEILQIERKRKAMREICAREDAPLKGLKHVNTLVKEFPVGKFRLPDKLSRENLLLSIRKGKQIALRHVPAQAIRDYSIPKIQQFSTAFEKGSTLSLSLILESLHKLYRIGATILPTSKTSIARIISTLTPLPPFDREQIIRKQKLSKYICAQQQFTLRHLTQTKDRSGPVLEIITLKHGYYRVELMEAIRAGVKLRHVTSIRDKSAPKLPKDFVLRKTPAVLAKARSSARKIYYKAKRSSKNFRSSLHLPKLPSSKQLPLPQPLFSRFRSYDYSTQVVRWRIVSNIIAECHVALVHVEEKDIKDRSAPCLAGVELKCCYNRAALMEEIRGEHALRVVRCNNRSAPVIERDSKIRYSQTTSVLTRAKSAAQVGIFRAKGKVNSLTQSFSESRITSISSIPRPNLSKLPKPFAHLKQQAVATLTASFVITCDTLQIARKERLNRQIINLEFNLKEVSAESISDLSAPRLENVTVKKNLNRKLLMEEIRQGKQLRKTTGIRDRSAAKIESGIVIQRSIRSSILGNLKSSATFISFKAKSTVHKLPSPPQTRKPTPVAAVKNVAEKDNTHYFTQLGRKERLNKEIDSQGTKLTHITDINDKSVPTFDSSSLKIGYNRSALMEELRQGTTLAHVECVDRSAPLIEEGLVIRKTEKSKVLYSLKSSAQNIYNKASETASTASNNISQITLPSVSFSNLNKSVELKFSQVKSGAKSFYTKAKYSKNTFKREDKNATIPLDVVQFARKEKLLKSIRGSQNFENLNHVVSV
eukprot:TRINITY_DN7051_c0_g1_i9.p1 TRINITY_DN7051_c0_g1~~TRINITY_DN7051_c0_g1_i9.p1  ORF type:complete len:1180 (-),score=311.13 TRINITY_DN7051_c0_g1_i9:233-3772(-)